MSTDYAPLFKNAVGRPQRFGAEESLTWDFTSAAGDPMTLLVGGAPYFTFDRTGALLIESDILWNTDSSGDIGAQFDTRPDVVNVATTIAVGAVAAGALPGAMLALNTLTLGHADVDKYIDAEQGLVNTPALRYNAVNTRWEFSDNGIVYVAFSAGFGTTTWDALYAADKTLIIDSTVLTFNQTATTGIAFTVSRNLAPPNTDSPIMTVDQLNAADTQPALALGQNAGTISALDIYDGTVAAGTKSFGFVAEGQLTIDTNAALGGAAVAITQNDDNQPFTALVGTSAADASKNISSANGATADVFLVTVGGASRWVPAYNSHILPGAPSWDSIYAADQALDINLVAGLTFSQSVAATGVGFTVSRNLDLTNTSDTIMLVANTNTGDDRAALTVTGGIADVVATVPTLHVYTAAAGMATAGAGNISYGIQSEVVPNAGDAAGSLLESFHATITGAGAGSATTSGFRTDAGFTYGLYTLSPVYIAATADVLGVEIISTVTAGVGVLATNSISYTSPTLIAADDVILLEIAAAQNAGDDPLSFTTGLSITNAVVGGADVNTALLIDANWQSGITSASPVTVSQVSTTGTTLDVSRNLALASTDSPIVRFDNDNTGDDQATLIVTGGIANVTTVVPVVHVTATSAGMTTGNTNDLYGVQSEVVPNVGDAAFSELEAFRATITGAGTGAATTYGFRAEIGFTYGVHSLSPVYVAAPADVLGAEIVSAFTPGAGTLVANKITYTAPAKVLNGDNLTLFEIDAALHADDEAFSFTTGLSITNSVPSLVGINIGMVIDSGWALAAAYNAPIGVSQTVASSGAVNTLNVTRDLAAVDTAGSVVNFEDSNVGDDWDVLRVSQYGTGDIQAWYQAAVPRMTLSAAGATAATPANPTAPFDVHTITMTSGGLDNEAMKGLVIDLTGAGAGVDLNSAPVYGIDLAYTTGGGSNLPYGLVINNGWTRGIDCGSAAYLNGTVTTGGLLTVNGHASFTALGYIAIGGGGDESMIWPDTTADQLVWGIGAGLGSQWVFGPRAAYNQDFDHVPQANPTLFVHSVLAPDTDNGEFFSLSYTGLRGGTLETDLPTYDFTIKGSNAGAASTGANQDGGNLILAGGDAYSTGVPGIVQVVTQTEFTWTFGVATVEMDQVKLVGASPAAGLGGVGAVAVMQKFEYTPDSDDVTNSIIVGSWYDMTAAPEADVPSAAIFIGDGPGATTSSWAQGIACYSPGNAFQYTGVCGADTSIINVTADPSNLLADGSYLKGVTVSIAGNAGDHPNSNIIGIRSRLTFATAGVSTAFRVEDALWKNAFISEGGLWIIDGSDAGTLFVMGQSGAGDIMLLRDGTAGAGTDRFTVPESGAVEIDADDTTNGLRVGNSGAGGNLLELIDGLVASGDQRFLVAEDGEVTITTTNALGSQAVSINQADQDQAFIDYAGVAGASNDTCITSFKGGAGTVQGPTGQSVAEAYFTHAGMIMIEINGATFWQPYYEYHAS